MKTTFLCSFLLLVLAVNPVKAQDNGEALSALGATVALSSYNTYTAIGAMSDGFVNGTYDAPTFTNLMNEQVRILGNVQTQINELLASGYALSDGDRVFFQDYATLLGTYQDMCNASLAYAESGNIEDAELFDSHRATAWDQLSKLLGFEN
jgi:hypothetical protein